MAKGHIEFTMCVSVFLIRVRPITSLCMVGFKNYLAQMINKIRRCVARKNYVTRSRFKVTVGTQSFCVLKSCPTHNFIMHGGILKLFSKNDHHNKAMCRV